MAHVELSLSGAFVPQSRTPADADLLSGVDRWTATVLTAAEPCLVIDVAATILAVSPSCRELLGLGHAGDLAGQSLLGGVLQLIDFTAGGGELDEPELEKIPPLLALRSRRLARGLMRVRTGPGHPPLTVDAITTPLLHGDRVVAALTFFAPVR